MPNHLVDSEQAVYDTYQRFLTQICEDTISPRNDAKRALAAQLTVALAANDAVDALYELVHAVPQDVLGC